jgi:hypothetical protein
VPCSELRDLDVRRARPQLRRLVRCPCRRILCTHRHTSHVTPWMLDAFILHTATRVRQTTKRACVYVQIWTVAHLAHSRP